ncbi:hypothetical protein L208DRAFT_667388 [Tricholoma matsutake]|nr:hypothetical protein L208DRAFT_667388 [Tricholoma matsutake 945]
MFSHKYSACNYICNPNSFTYPIKPFTGRKLSACHTSHRQLTNPKIRQVCHTSQGVMN